MTVRLWLAVAFIIAVLASSGTRFGIAEATQPNQATADTTQTHQNDMMKMHEQMMADMKAGDATLDALVKEMNAAKGEAKVNALAAVVTELVGQHKAMHNHMGEMHQHMMGMGGMMMHR